MRRIVVVVDGDPMPFEGVNIRVLNKPTKDGKEMLVVMEEETIGGFLKWDYWFRG